MDEKISRKKTLELQQIAVDDLVRLKEQYQLAVDGSGVGLWDWHVQTGYAVFNERWAEIIGFTLEELQPVSIETWIQHTLPEDLERSNAALDDHFSGLTDVYECEARMKHKSGDWVWVLDRGRVVEWDAAGKPVRMVGTHLDITDRKAFEAALAQSEIRYRELFNNMSSGVAVYKAVNDGDDFVFVDFNQAGERIDNVQKEGLIGKSVQQAFPGVKDFGLFAVFQRVWQTGVPEQHPISQYRDERLVGWRENFVYKLPSGEIVAVYTDITEQKQAELALQASEERYRLISEMISDFAYSFSFTSDGKTIYEWVTQGFTKTLGYSVEEIVARGGTLSLVHPDDLEIAKQHIQILLSGQEDTREYRIISKDGQIHWLRNFARPIVDEHTGRVTRIVGSTQVITEQKQAQMSLEALAAELEDRVAARTADLQIVVNAMAGREVRMADLKKVIRKLRAQLKALGVTPVANDPYLEPFEDE